MLGMWLLSLPPCSETIVEVEGALVEPFTVDTLSGQRYSVLLHTNQSADDYWMYHLVFDLPLPALHASAPPPNHHSRMDPPNLVPRDLKRAAGPDGKLANTGKLRWGLNNQSFSSPSTAILMHDYAHTLKSLPEGSQPIAVSAGEIIDIIVQDTVGLNGICEEHPWHL
ncbi:hypothetical protein BDK51DRAFT_31105, partial [Blyttiomyces helicus]